MTNPASRHRAKHLTYSATSLLLWLLSMGCVVLVLIFLLPLAVPYIKDATRFSYVVAALSVEHTISAFIARYVPTVIGGVDITRGGVIFIAILLSSQLNGARVWFNRRITHLRANNEFEALKAERNLSDNHAALAPLKMKLENLKSATKGKEREELLKLFAETKRKLDSMTRDLAFLAIDIVDSTGMKQGEEKAIIEHDFHEYKKFVEEKMVRNGALKASWTPDGIMICYPAVDAAVRTAREIIQGLEAFNRNVKTMKADFRVRCGINYGYVYFDDSIPMEEMSDRVIDIAGHMQKYAQPNTINIAKSAIEPMMERAGFAPASKVVDGQEVYMWTDVAGNGRAAC